MSEILKIRRASYTLELSWDEEGECRVEMDDAYSTDGYTALYLSSEEIDQVIDFLTRGPQPQPPPPEST